VPGPADTLRAWSDLRRAWSSGVGARDEEASAWWICDVGTPGGVRGVVVLGGAECGGWTVVGMTGEAVGMTGEDRRGSGGAAWGGGSGGTLSIVGVPGRWGRRRS
jgi:hypothetical protein